MQYVEFNPYWTVPFSISNGEILPKLKSDPAYLSRNNMDLLSMSGNAVPLSSVDFKKYASKMPYMLRQGPGANNALGRVKFLFPNRFSVYLHDTPSRNLFSKEERAFSHGCIRVENPLKFASHVLLEQGFTSAKIDSIVKAGRNFRVNLKKVLPVIITYSTAFADQDLVYFYKDVYKRDEALMMALGI
jgi:murein L,D-transpeptidase YcbB/YkuD